MREPDEITGTKYRSKSARKVELKSKPRTCCEQVRGKKGKTQMSIAFSAKNPSPVNNLGSRSAEGREEQLPANILRFEPFDKVPRWLTDYLDSQGARWLRPYAEDVLRWTLRSTGACHYPNENSDPAGESLSRRWDCDVRTVRNILKKLETLGVLELERKKTPRGWQSALRIVKPESLYPTGDQTPANRNPDPGQPESKFRPTGNEIPVLLSDLDLKTKDLQRGGVLENLANAKEEPACPPPPVFEFPAVSSEETPSVRNQFDALEKQLREILRIDYGIDPDHREACGWKLRLRLEKDGFTEAKIERAVRAVAEDGRGPEGDQDPLMYALIHVRAILGRTNGAGSAAAMEAAAGLRPYHRAPEIAWCLTCHESRWNGHAPWCKAAEKEVRCEAERE